MFQIPKKPDITTNFVVIGAGVTGMEVARILHEHETDFWLLGSPYESQLAKTSTLSGPLLPEDMTGLQFMEKEIEDLKSLTINHSSSLVTSIEHIGDSIKVNTRYQSYITKGALIAIGLKQGKLGFEGEEKLFRYGVSDCAVCDYPLYREQPAAVVGNHKYTEKAARFVAQHCIPTYLLWYQDENPPEIDGMKIYVGVRNLVAIGKKSGDEEFLERIVFDHQDGHEELQVDVMFVEGAPVPSTNFLKDSGIELSDGYIVIDDNFSTSLKGVFSAGDVTGKTSTYKEAKEHGNQVAQIILDYLS